MLAAKAKRKGLKLSGTSTSRCLQPKNGNISSKCSNAKSKAQAKAKNGTTTASNFPKPTNSKSKIPVPIPPSRKNPILYKEPPFNANKLEIKLGLLNRSIATSISFRPSQEKVPSVRFGTPVMAPGLIAELKEVQQLRRRNHAKKMQVITPVMSPTRIADRLKEVQQRRRINRLKQFDANRSVVNQAESSSAAAAKFNNQSGQNNTKAEMLRNARVVAYETRVKQLYSQPES